MQCFEAISILTIVTCMIHVEYLGYHKLVLVINFGLIFYLYLYHLREVKKAKLKSQAETHSRVSHALPDLTAVHTSRAANLDIVTHKVESSTELVPLDSLELKKATFKSQAETHSRVGHALPNLEAVHKSRAANLDIVTHKCEFTDLVPVDSLELCRQKHIVKDNRHLFGH